MRKVKWGVLGTAGILGCSAVGMQRAEHCELYAIAGRNEQKAELFREKYGFERAYDSYEALLSDEQVQAVYIPLPNDMHCEWTIKALQHKKHVLCEKPLAPSVEQIEKMFRAAEDNGVFLMEAFAYQHSPYMTALEQEIKSGAIGEVRYIETAFITSDYDIGNIRMRRETFGGSMYDLGVYNTSFILRLLGEQPIDVKAVADFSEQGVDMLTGALLTYPNNRRAVFTCAMTLATEKSLRMDRFEIQGTKGSVCGVNFEYNGSGDLKYKLTSNDGSSKIKTVHVPDNYALEMEQFSRCVLGEDTPKVTKQFSMENARTVERVLEAIAY